MGQGAAAGVIDTEAVQRRLRTGVEAGAALCPAGDELGQRVGLQFRAEAFNVFNNVNFRLPNSNLSSAQFGQITQVIDNNQRIIQLGLKLLF